MATIQNDRDVRLQATVPRNLNPGAGKLLLLVCDTNNFQVTNLGVAAPTAINFTAYLVGFPAGTTATFSCSAGGTLTGTGNTRQLTYVNMSVGSVTVTATLTYNSVTYSDIKLITKVVDGATAGVSTAVIYAYQRAAVAPTLKPGAITYTFASGSITTPATDALSNGWTKTLPAGTDPLYVCVCTASASAATDTVADTEWTTPVLLVNNGTNGINTATIFLYQRAATNSAPSLPSVATTWTFATATLTAPNNGWTTVPPSSGGDYLFVTQATAAASTATDNIPASEWSTAVLMVNNGINGTSALHNGQAYAYQRSATALSSNPGDVTYNFANGTISTASLANGWSKAIPAGTDPLYITVAAASSLNTTDTILAAEWAAPVKLVQDGLAGLNTTTVFIYQRGASATAPSLPSAATTYTFNPPGLTGLNNGWSTVIPASGGNYVFVSTATAASTSATDAIPASEWAAASILSQDGLGVRGAGAYFASGSTWSDSVADTATPGANVVDDVVTISNGTSFVSVKKWNGSAWVAQGVVIDGGLVVPGTITANQINSNGLTVRDASGNVMIGSGSALDWAKLVASGITGGASIQNSSISIAANGTLSGAGGGSVSITGLGYTGDLAATRNTGAFANLSGTITAANAATYFASNSIAGTYIADLAANKINVGTMTGHTIQTAASGTRIVINSGSNNKIEAYSGSTLVAEFGGTSNGFINAVSSSSLMAALSATGSGSFPAMTSSSSSSGPAGFFSASSGIGLSTQSSSGNALVIAGGSNGIVQTGGGSNYINTLNPATDGAYSLGSSGSFRWSALYANSATITTSDARTKTDTENSDLGLDFIDSLRPVKYRQIVSERKVTDIPVEPTEEHPWPSVRQEVVEVAGTRFHYGLIAQEVRAALLAAGVSDAAIWSLSDPSQPDSQQALRYEEMIGPLIRAIQELRGQVRELQAGKTPL